MKATLDRGVWTQWLILALVLLLVGGLGAYWQVEDRTRIDRQEREKLVGRARIAEENLVHHLTAIDTMLSAVAKEVAVSNTPARASDQLAMLALAMPAVRTISLFDAEGTLVASNRPAMVGRNFVQRDYFQRARRGADPDALYVGEPFTSSLGIHSMNFVRVIRRPDGGFAGIVAATLDPDEFKALFNSIRYAPDMISAIVHDGGKLFIRLPEPPGKQIMDASSPDSFFSRHRASGLAASVQVRADPHTGTRRIAVLHTLRPARLNMDAPLVIAVMRDEAPIFADWRRQSARLAGLYALLVLASAIGMLAYQRRQRERLAVEAALVESENRFRRVSSLTSDLVYSCHRGDDGLFRIDWVGGRAERVFGYPAEEIQALGCWCSHVLAEDQSLFAEHITGLQPGQTSDVILRASHRDGSVHHLRSVAQVEDDPEGRGHHRLYGAVQDVTERVELEQRLARLAHTDSLTGLANRGYFLELAAMELARVRRYHGPLALAMLDLDHFKQVNDTYGHEVGDRVLRQFAVTCHEVLREADLMGRYGGEEFVILFPETAVEQAFEVAERVREAIAGMTIPLEHGMPIQITVSLGVAAYQEGDANLDVLLNRADQALYEAKRGGRGRTCVAA